MSHVVNSGSEQPCGQTPFTITMISDDAGPVVSSTIRTAATEALDGTVIECFAVVSRFAIDAGRFASWPG